MAILDRIPIPGQGLDEFQQGMTGTQNILNSLMNNQMNPYRQALAAEQIKNLQSSQELNPYRKNLLQAQVIETNAKGARDRFIANLLKRGFEQNRPQINQAPQEQQGQLGQNPSQNNLNSQNNISNLQNGNVNNQNQIIPPSGTNPDIDMLYALGILKETPGQRAAREKSTAWSKEIGASDVKTIDKWNTTITANHEMVPVLENIQEAVANPVTQEMYKNPQYFGYDISYLKRFGTPEQQEQLNKISTNAKSIYQAMGQDFKGAFREFELKIFNAATPNENDTLQGLITKTNTLLSLRKLVNDRLTLAQNIVRQSQGSISPANALNIADKQINSKNISKQIENQFNTSVKEQKRLKDFKDSVVTVILPNNKEWVIQKRYLDAAKKDVPGLRIKEGFTNA